LNGCAALFSFLGLLAAAVLATWGAQLLTGERRDDVLLMAGVLVVAGTLLVAWDWRRLGPTVALQSGTVAAAFSWLLVVPLGLVGFELVEVMPLVGYVVLSVTVLVTLTLVLQSLGCILGMVAGGTIMFCSTQVDSFIVDLIGMVMVYAAVYTAARKAITLRRIDHWPGAEEVDSMSDEFQNRCDYFMRACKPWQHKYDFRLTIQHLYRMSSANHRMRGANVRHLFHGTPWEAAQGIVHDGFRLPDHPGMFGKGIYFADCPLKSWQYTRSMEQLVCCKRGGLILMCSVDLGESRREARANTHLSGYDRKGWWAWLTGQYGAYDSVVGLEHRQGGALRVPEYVIYSPNNARIEYIFEVAKRSPDKSGE